MITTEENLRNLSLIDVAAKMLTAARTAPKARGIDNLILAVATDDTIRIISDKMKEIGNSQENYLFFLRDAENILTAKAIVLISTKIKSNGINCGLCGYPDCYGKNQVKMAPCAFNTNDLGIAIGSAVSIAADHRVDNRVMFSIGIAVKELKLLGDEAAIIFGIPLSATSKSPFFDRKTL
ncbi:MAG: ferredoxin domain-containing protein [Bacteroidales bacterium]